MDVTCNGINADNIKNLIDKLHEAFNSTYKVLKNWLNNILFALKNTSNNRLGKIRFKQLEKAKIPRHS